MTSLFDIIKAQYLIHSDPGEFFTLSSGEKSNHYYDIKAMMGNHDHMRRIVNAISHKIFAENIKFNSIGGTELGGIPLATALQENYHDTDVCFIRKGERIHGMKRMIEGVPVSPILLIDDVLNSGTTILDANSTCNRDELLVAGCLCVINRMAADKQEHLEKFMGFKIYSLFMENDFGY